MEGSLYRIEAEPTLITGNIIRQNETFYAHFRCLFIQYNRISEMLS